MTGGAAYLVLKQAMDNLAEAIEDLSTGIWWLDLIFILAIAYIVRKMWPVILIAAIAAVIVVVITAT